MIEKLLLIFLIALIPAFFLSFIPRKLKERHQFIKAATEFRKTFNQILADIQYSRFGFYGSDDILKICRIAYLNFRPYLHRICYHQYDEAWDNLCYHFKSSGVDIIKKDIKSLLKFTKRRGFNNIFYWVIKFFNKLRWKIFGPDKKTKELVEKYFGQNKSPHS